MAQAMQEFGVDPQTGLAPIQWNSWETEWSWSRTLDRKTKKERNKQKTTEEEIIKAGWINGGRGVNHSR